MSYITNKFKKLGRKETYNHFFSTLRYSLHVITHPADGYWDLIHAKRGSYAAANFLVIMTLLVHIWKLRFTSFLFLDVNWEKDVNVLIEIASIILPLAIFCICNWACTTLFDGKGHLELLVTVVLQSRDMPAPGSVAMLVASCSQGNSLVDIIILGDIRADELIVNNPSGSVLRNHLVGK